ncbi:nitroreductase family protein [Saccharomonospora sp. NPDC006951]
MNGFDDDQGYRRIDLTSSPEDGGLARLVRRRRSVKSYRPGRLGLERLSGLLETTLGARTAGRPYGSAHARYDVAVTVVAAAVDGLVPGAYRYLPGEHALLGVGEGDHRRGLAEATLDAAWLTECPVVLLLSADLAAANEAFAAQETGRGERFCWFEAGLVAQNVYLWAAGNALGTVFLGGLDSAAVAMVTRGLVPPGQTVLGMVPIGHPAQ